jgi:chorismate-pyruvate lyase
VRGTPLPVVTIVAPEDIPEPYRSLLVHDSDMTSTLENFYQDKLRVHVLGRHMVEDKYLREVALTLDRTGRRVEYGAIKISIDLFPMEARREILRGEVPLGRILTAFGVAFSSRPSAYLRVASDEFITGALDLELSHLLFGRRNTLLDSWDRPLAEIIEILPPN